MARDTLGRWVMMTITHEMPLIVGADPGPWSFSVIGVGASSHQAAPEPEYFPRVSARRALDALGRTVLIPAATQAVHESDALAAEAHRLSADGHNDKAAPLLDQSEAETVRNVDGYVVRVRISRTPITQSVVCVLANVARPDQDILDPPPVGAWEWDITPGPDGPTSTITHWSPNVARLYGYSSQEEMRALVTMPTANWQNDLIAPDSRLHMHGYIAKLVKMSEPDLDDELFIAHPYVKTRNGDSRFRMPMRVTWNADNQVVGFLGFSHEAIADTQEVYGRIVGRPAAPLVEAFDRTIGDLLTDTLLVIVTTAGEVYDQSSHATWQRLGLAPDDYLDPVPSGAAAPGRAAPGHFDLRSKVHPDDWATLTTLVSQSDNSRTENPQPITACIRIFVVEEAGQPGDWARFEIAAVPLFGISGRVACRIRRI